MTGRKRGRRQGWNRERWKERVGKREIGIGERERERERGVGESEDTGVRQGWEKDRTRDMVV